MTGIIVGHAMGEEGDAINKHKYKYKLEYKSKYKYKSHARGEEGDDINKAPVLILSWSN